jgi:hypothetical protein
MEIDKIVAEVEMDCRTFMHQILSDLVSTKKIDSMNENCEILNEITCKFNDEIEKIMIRHKKNIDL